MVARVGGAEFLVAAEAPHAQLMLLAAQLADQLGRAFPIGALTTTVGCRIGVTCRRDGDDAAALLRHASEALRSEEHTSELQSLMRISYAVFCLKKKKQYNPKKKKQCSNVASISDI